MRRRDVGTFGRSVRWYRRLAGFTQQDLADSSGLSVAAIRSYETGVRTEPRAHSLRQLATALGVSIETLVTSCEPPLAEPRLPKYVRPRFRSLLPED